MAVPAFTQELVETIARSKALAKSYGAISFRDEHLLLALSEDPDAANVMTSCGIDLDLLRKKLIDVVIEEKYLRATEKDHSFYKRFRNKAIRWATSSVLDGGDITVRRAEIHGAAAGQKVISGAQVLAMLFYGGGTSKAVSLLKEQGMTQYRALNFISHGSSTLIDASLNNAPSEAVENCNVRLLNDDYTPMDFVTQVIQSFFDKTLEEAKKLMLQIHNSGMCICGTYQCSVAAAKINAVMEHARLNEYPLKCTLDKQ